ncbi:MAG: IPT/TIG domain-containing protein [Tunicatimonas sp.]|uniref:IPT/TIG domain-containing protein n=1 Tax=Tunicatimonas sp. TaxID=1940096 RepID=UPI003C796E1D
MWILILFGIVCCEKEDPIILPQLVISEAFDITNNTATIQAQVIEKGTEEVLEYGFQWQEGREPNEISPVEILDSPFAEGLITTTLSNLKLGTTYYYRIYARTKTDTYRSSTISFSTSSPQLEKLSPTEGTTNTKVVITGQYFGVEPEQVSVFMAGDTASILEMTDTQITFIAPKTSTGSVEVTVRVGGAVSNALPFNYQAGFTFSPNKVRQGVTLSVIIPGQGSGNVFRVGGVKVESEGEYPRNGGREYIVKIPKDVSVGEATIEVVDGNGNSIPNADEAPLTVLSGGNWTQKQSLPEGQVKNTVGFAINNKGYVLIKNNLYTYDPVAEVWSLYQTFDNSVALRYMRAVVIAEKAYILSGTKLWQFDPTTKLLTPRKDFPGNGRRELLSFTDGIHGFFGMGESDGSKNPLDFWKYDPASDTWLRLADFPSDGLNVFNPPVGVYINGKGYIVSAKVYQYDTATDTFAEIESDAYIHMDNAIYVLNNKVYYLDFYLDRFFEYDPVENELIEEVGFPGQDRIDPFTFIINDKMYMGAGWGYIDRRQTTYQDVWQFVPGK